MITSFIRTYSHWVVVWLAAGLASIGIDITDAQQAALVGVISMLAGWAWYAVIRRLEQRYPWASRLLGSTSQPLYVDSRDVTTTSKEQHA